MKKILLVIIFTLLLTLLFSGSKAYVKTKICPVFSQPNNSSEKVTVLSNSTEVTIISEQNDWLQIKSGNFSGYVQKIFIGDSPTLQVNTNSNSLSEMADVRKRASYYSSSAAAIRGLSSENVSERENVSFRNYDFDSVNWLEKNFNYSEDEIIKFSEKELTNF